jgi:hypothetical protein
MIYEQLKPQLPIEDLIWNFVMFLLYFKNL